MDKFPHPKIEGYLLLPHHHDKLHHIMRRIYADKRLEGDERRDIANTLYAILHATQPMTDQDIKCGR